MSATGDDTLWAHAAAVAVMLGTGGGFVKWLLGKIEAVRAEADSRIESVRRELIDQRRELLERFEDHERKAAIAQEREQQFREHMLATNATKGDVDRAVDRLRDDLLDRLDARFAPLRDRKRGSEQ